MKSVFFVCAFFDRPCGGGTGWPLPLPLPFPPLD